MVKEEKARAIENMIIESFQRGQIREKLTEARLVELLEQINQQTKSEPTIKVC